MGQKEEILAAMEYKSLTISEIHERTPNISKEQFRTLIHRLRKEGKIKEVGEKLNQKVYRINNYYFTQSNSLDIDIDQYPDINVDLQALQIAEQLIIGPIKNFLENPKIYLRAIFDFRFFYLLYIRLLVLSCYLSIVEGH